MKSTQKARLILMVLGIIFALSAISNNNISSDQENSEGGIEIRDETNVKSPKKSGYWTLDFIHIDDNWSDAEAEDWCNGNGSWGNPYVIENVTIDASSSPTGSGIYINNSKTEYFIIRNCTVYNAGGGQYDAGIILENTNNGILINNTCSNNGYAGIMLFTNCENNTISGNTANDNGNQGIILIFNCNNNTISKNTANDNEDHGIYIGSCGNNTISGNTASNEGTTNQNDGIRLRWGSNLNIISGNAVTNNTGTGISLNNGCVNNTISKNTLTDNRWGMFLYINCNNNTFSGNTVKNSIHGMELYDSDGNSISENSVINNRDYGIRLTTNTDKTTISGNIIKDNPSLGIRVSSTCDSTLICYNSFIVNNIDAVDDGNNNQWNHSAIGNYWDTHTSPDSDNDGIVDNPFIGILGGANTIDSFPLVESPHHFGEKIHIDESSVSAWKWSKTAKLKIWCTGSGKLSDRYIIDGLEIDGGGSGSSIIIGNSSVFFTIQNCKVYNAGSGPQDAGIKLENTNNGTLTNNNCSDNQGHGITLRDYCDNNTISGNDVINNTIGIALCNSSHNRISDNLVSNNSYSGIYLDPSNYNDILYNDIKYNYYGIYLNNSKYNTLLGNMFIGNVIDVFDTEAKDIVVISGDGDDDDDDKEGEAIPGYNLYLAIGLIGIITIILIKKRKKSLN